jgi:hypothetical protein
LKWWSVSLSNCPKLRLAWERWKQEQRKHWKRHW